MIPRRVSAAFATGAIALAGAGIMLAPSASAGTVTPTVKCVLPAGQGTFEGPQEMKVDLSPANPKAGEAVTATVDMGDSPAVSTQTLAEVEITPSITLAMHGGATGEVTATGPMYKTPITKDQQVPMPIYSGDFIIPANASGKIEFTVVKTVSMTKALGFTLPTTCTVTAGLDLVIADVTATPGEVGEPTLTAPATVSVGNTIALSGENWTPSATPTVSLCSALGTDCSTETIVSDTLAIDAAGKLSGNARVPATTATGTYTIKVTDGAKEVLSSSITLTPWAPGGPRQLTASPAKGPVGTEVTLTGKDYKANRAIQIWQYDALGNRLGTYTDGGRSSAIGEWTAKTVITDPTTASLMATEGSNVANGTSVPFLVSNDLDQTITGSILPGSLAMSQAGSGIDLGSVTLNGTEQTMSGALNQVTVVDARSGNLGWTLTGTMTDLALEDASSKIPAGNVSWTPNCVATEGSPSTVTSGAAGPLGSTAAALCTQAPSAEGVTGGKFTADAAIAVKVPAYAKPGTYTGSLTLSLS